MPTAAPLFGSMLKTWRHHRHVSQLELAMRAGVSQRHVSFLETGRSNPSKPMVLALANSLDLPMREQNALLVGAGFSAAYAQPTLDEDSHALFKQALQYSLDHAEPYPAMVLDGRWNLVMANQGALAFFGQFIDIFGALAEIGNPDAFQMVHLCLDEKGFAPFIVNWEELTASFLSRARRSLLHNPNDPLLAELIEQILSHPRAPKDWHTVWVANTAPALQMVMRKGDQEFRLFTMLAHFGAPTDVTLEELSVELFYPADNDTRAHLHSLAAH